MVPGGLQDYSTTTTAVTRGIVFPAAVTGVTADSWNVTGDIARRVVRRRKGKLEGGKERDCYSWQQAPE
ncbi:hypothetical protein X777_07541 [Ooceraea biroi]|uniref:Uncharacterized protein n=1 Tax=Ooceraea biroi TaxID=2015173 RepID=A0A026X3Z7_OOCBI|nr:hypothetical protein X777_07540 [Ooceraea biroi]EZA62726.1 hypothetical protein X777_07541 [Ooceraea biroi]